MSYSVSLLPPANEVWGKVIFLHLFVILFTGGHAWLPGGHAWLRGGPHGCRGACVVAGGCVVARGHAWLPGEHAWLPGVACMVAGGDGGMHGCWGACMVAGGHASLLGACIIAGEGSVHGCWGMGGVHRIRRDTVNERAVRILLECILVFFWVLFLTVKSRSFI